MDSDERLRSVYGKVLNALEEALSWLQRPPAEGPDVHDVSGRGCSTSGRRVDSRLSVACRRSSRRPSSMTSPMPPRNGIWTELARSGGRF